MRVENIAGLAFMDAHKRLVYWLLAATRGGPTRVKILKSLDKKPLNMRQLSLNLNLDYKTVQGHIKILTQHSILDTEGNKYGAIYFISPEWLDNNYLNEFIRGNEQ
ncbi:MAG: winged helix-turn-helix domain-containing protein [Candidatus Micrarchaeota archaeon]